MPTLDPFQQPTAYTRAGWYPDPVTDGRTERWWDGTRWGGYSRPRSTADALPPPEAVAAMRRRNSPARLSLLVGILSLLVAVAAVLAGGRFWFSGTGVIAIVLGVRAIRLRERGLATAVVPAVMGVTAGGFATLVAVALILVPVGPSARSAAAGPYGAVPVDPASDAPTISATASAAVDPGAPQPRATLPDRLLDAYTDVPVGSLTAAAAGCGVLQADLEAFPIGGGTGGEAKRMQDFADLQLQAYAGVLLRGPQVTTPMHWPSAIDVDPETRIVFLPDDGCQPIGVVPKGDELHYAMSPDRGQAALALWNAAYRTGELWRTVDDTIYPL
jgi:hypothetical protein